jgi:uncharacterized protein (TIGR02266 family)
MKERSENRRKFARIPLEARVRIVMRDKEDAYEYFTTNLSSGGLFIKAEQPKPIGHPIHFELFITNDQLLIKGVGVVQWIAQGEQSEKGMGIQFVELNEEGRRALEAVFREKPRNRP